MTTPAAETLLCFDHVSKWYGQVSALMDVSFAVGAEVIGLVGRNGAGKSTLLKLACGLLRPSLGRVTVTGIAPDQPAARHQIGFSPDVDNLYENLTGVTFVSWMLRLHGHSGRHARELAAATLDRLGLGSHMHRRIGEYSKGMRQRVRLAQVLAHSPRVVLLDEPMTGLDPIARHEMGVLVAQLAAAGTAVVVSSHVLHELEAMVARVALVHQGRLLAEGRVDELRGQLRGQPHRLRLTTGEPRALAAALVALEQVVGLELMRDGVEVAVNGEPGFYAALTRLGAEPRGLVRELVPVDDSLASVFGYLVG